MLRVRKFRNERKPSPQPTLPSEIQLPGPGLLNLLRLEWFLLVPLRKSKTTTTISEPNLKQGLLVKKMDTGLVWKEEEEAY